MTQIFSVLGLKVWVLVLTTPLLCFLRHISPLLIRYDERIDRVETRITARLRDQLGTAKNANEMFRIFSRFNALFVRPHIRGAIREYQTQLIQRVKDDIEALHDKFKVKKLPGDDFRKRD